MGSGGNGRRDKWTVWVVEKDRRIRKLNTSDSNVGPPMTMTLPQPWDHKITWEKISG
jgi:hypothetical protein